jgi:hypothetical protein
MGQQASKAASKSATEAAKKVAQNQKLRSPPLPPPRPPRHDASTGKPTSEAANPGSFLRGEGLATQDIRDVGQEMFLQEKHQVDDEAKAKGPPEMSQDLLKFIQDVGPAKQEVDKDQTSPRLLEKENEKELQKLESSRQAVRERTRMPLMGEDQTFTATRNTNFSSRPADTKKRFGVTNIQLYYLLSKSGTETDIDAFVDEHHKKLIGEEEGWTEEEIEQQKTWIKQSLDCLEIPVLRKDPDGNILGLYPDSVPGAEVKWLRPIPPTKVKLVLDDVLNDRDGALRKARDNLERSRQDRIQS